jgi:hypothetical protein
MKGFEEGIIIQHIFYSKFKNNNKMSTFSKKCSKLSVGLIFVHFR